MKTQNKKKLSDVTRAATLDKANRFAATMLPQSPMQKEEPKTEPEQPSSSAAPLIVDPVDSDLNPQVITESKPMSSTQAKAKGEASAEKLAASTVTKSTRSRKGAAFTIDDVVLPATPKGEAYPRQVRISDVHHYLLKEIAFKNRTTINHVLYNLLDLLSEANQRDGQNHV